MAKIPIFLPLLLSAVCISAEAQPALPQLKAYLALTDAQISQIGENLTQYSQLVNQRQQRMFQVQGEIRQETAKSPLDPMALGMRYAEIETICRNVKDEAVAAQNRNLALLTDAQKTKLKTLQDAYSLWPIIAEAQNAGVLAPPGPYGISHWFNTSGFIVPAVLSGCQQPVSIPTVAIRVGDFTTNP